MASSKIEDVVLLHGGDLSSDIAEQIATKLPINDTTHIHRVSMSKSKDFKTALLEGPLAKPTTLAIFIAQTIENEAPPETAGACIRFFKRKTHPETLLAGKIQFVVLGLGDSNLLLDRQHTAAKDCNQVAQALDARLEALGGKRFYQRGNVMSELVFWKLNRSLTCWWIRLRSVCSWIVSAIMMFTQQSIMVDAELMKERTG